MACQRRALAPVALERGACRVEGVGVELQGDAVVGPQCVDLPLLDEAVEDRLRQPRRAQQRDELSLCPRAGDGGVLDDRAQGGASGAAGSAGEGGRKLLLRDEVVDLRALDGVGEFECGQACRDLEECSGGRCHCDPVDGGDIVRVQRRDAVAADSASARAAADGGHVDRAFRCGTNAVQRQGRIVTRVRASATCEDGGARASLERRLGPRPDVHSDVERMQRTALDTARDLPPSDAEGEQLLPDDDAVLQAREHGDPQVDVSAGRIDVPATQDPGCLLARAKQRRLDPEPGSSRRWSTCWRWHACMVRGRSPSGARRARFVTDLLRLCEDCAPLAAIACRSAARAAPARRWALLHAMRAGTSVPVARRVRGRSFTRRRSPRRALAHGRSANALATARKAPHGHSS